MAILYNRSTGEILSERVSYARNALERVVRLLPRRTSADDEGLWYGGCQAVHTLGMRSNVDLVFLDGDLRVMRLEHGIRPGRPLVWCRGADCVLKMGQGFLARCDVLVGDLLWLEDSLVPFAYAVNS